MRAAPKPPLQLARVLRSWKSPKRARPLLKAKLLPKVDWDPTTARYWDRFNLDPNKPGQTIRLRGGYRQYDPFWVTDNGFWADATGMFIMPGIIDTHCHFAVSGGVNEFSLSIVPEVRIRDVIESEDVQIYRALAGGVTTARLLHGSANVIGGQDAVIKLKYGEPAGKLLLADAPRGVKFALGENVKRTDGRFPNTRLGVEAVLIRAFTEAQSYRKTWDDYDKRVAGF